MVKMILAEKNEVEEHRKTDFIGFWIFIKKKNISFLSLAISHYLNLST